MADDVKWTFARAKAPTKLFADARPEEQVEPRTVVLP